jgi:DNA topoisomerase-3
LRCFDDCCANTTVIGKEAADVAFKTTGKEILKKGWRIVFENPNAKEETDILPSFEKKVLFYSFRRNKANKNKLHGGHYCGPWKPGKRVDDEDLRELMKENGMDVHPRANIIETLSNANIS